MSQQGPPTEMLWTARAAQPVQTRRQQELAQQPVPPNVAWQLEQVEVRHPEELWRLHQSQMRDQLGRQELIERMVLFSLWLDQRAREVCSFEEYWGAAGIDPQIAPGGVGWDGWGGSRGRWVGGVRGWRVVGRVRVVCLGVWAVVGLGVGREQGRGAL